MDTYKVEWTDSIRSHGTPPSHHFSISFSVAHQVTAMALAEALAGAPHLSGVKATREGQAGEVIYPP